jgi:hypothetical protein
MAYYIDIDCDAIAEQLFRVAPDSGTIGASGPESGLGRNDATLSDE